MKEGGFDLSLLAELQLKTAAQGSISICSETLALSQIFLCLVLSVNRELSSGFAFLSSCILTAVLFTDSFCPAFCRDGGKCIA